MNHVIAWMHQSIENVVSSTNDGDLGWLIAHFITDEVWQHSLDLLSTVDTVLFLNWLGIHIAVVMFRRWMSCCGNSGSLKP